MLGQHHSASLPAIAEKVAQQAVETLLVKAVVGWVEVTGATEQSVRNASC